MDEEITIIDANTRNERIKNFFINNKRFFLIITSITLILLAGYFFINEIKEKNQIKLANQFNSTITNFNKVEKQKTINELVNIVNKQDVTYSPLALYFLIDNKLINNTDEINDLFNVLINKVNLEKEIKNLIIYKKALYNSNFMSENELIKILNPIINSESIWKSHALYLMAEYFFFKNEKQKAKEFFNQILTMPNANNDIKLESQKRINRDIGE
tara:strand:+ start:291 stop:935 length:645 start_codon:yes stop_codon:yes gene_type:complete